MSTINVVVETKKQDLAAGVTAAGIKIALSLAGTVTHSALLPAAPYTGSFLEVADGDYVVAAQAVDTAGGNIGDAITASVSVLTPAQPAPVESATPDAAIAAPAPAAEVVPAPVITVILQADVPASITTSVA